MAPGGREHALLTAEPDDGVQIDLEDWIRDQVAREKGEDAETVKPGEPEVVPSAPDQAPDFTA